jgi:hypothetical protein
VSGRIASILAIGGLACALVNCRAIVGIDTASLTYPDGGPTDDASSDRTPDDASLKEDTGEGTPRGSGAPEVGPPEAGPPEAGPPEAGPRGAAPEAATGCAASGNFGACTMCCRQTYMQQNGAFEMYLRSTGCICNGAACTSECSTSSCAAPPGGGQMSCPPCIDALVNANDCGPAIAACRNDAQCKPMADCMESCL